jgi:short-subunit dehydrogenase
MALSAPRSVLITGASSGLGEGLALSYAAPGVHLFLSGRDPSRLEEVAERCRTKGAIPNIRILDVSDDVAMDTWIHHADAIAPLDLVIANAGISAGTSSGDESAQQTRQVFKINIDGVANTVLPVIPLMRVRRAGQIAIMSSLAGFMGLPGSPAYSASKSAVRTWGESLRGWLAPDKVTVSVICPGFVTTRMTAVNQYKMPFLMECDQAVTIMRAGLDKGKARIAFPTVFYSIILLAASLPLWIRDLWIGMLPKKG